VVVRQIEAAEEITTDVRPIEHPRSFPIHPAEEPCGLDRLRRGAHAFNYSMINEAVPLSG
jgi:hypothetical protein